MKLKVTKEELERLVREHLKRNGFEILGAVEEEYDYHPFHDRTPSFDGYSVTIMEKRNETDGN